MSADESHVNISFRPDECSGTSSPQAVMNAIKQAIRDHNNQFVIAFVKSIVNEPSKYHELMRAAVYYGDKEIVEELVARGCQLASVPDSVALPDEKFALDCDLAYRPSPYIIQAASRGHMYCGATHL